jgi:hypothetical protein
MSTLITTAVLLLVVLWAMASYTRLVRLRRVVTNRWREVSGLRQRRQGAAEDMSTPGGAAVDLSESDSALEQARLHYNLVATKYNTALARLPNNVVASLAGFKPAELLSPEEAAGTATGASS